MALTDIPRDTTGRHLALLVVATFAAFANYAVLLPVVSAWAAHGGADATGAGLTTTAFMVTTVLTQAVVPAAGRRLGYRTTFGVGTAVMVLPTLAYALTAALPALVTISAVRGVGFGLLSVSGSALVAELAPPARRGRASGLYGLGVALPNVFLVPAAVAVVDTIGYPTLFVAITAVPLAAVAVLALPRTPAVAGDHDGPAPVRGPVARRFAGPVGVMLPVAVAATAVITFAPLALPGAAPTALLVFGAAALVARWVAGHVADRYPRAPGLLPGAVLAAAAGLAVLALAAYLADVRTVLAVVGALLLGAGFGTAQNQTLVVLFHRAGPGRHGTASAVWNMALDSGTGIGGVLLGAVATHTAYPYAFVLTGALLLCCLPLSRTRQRRVRD
ncbi:MAG TPA: MFS transporter [Actinocatenispora sp.]